MQFELVVVQKRFRRNFGPMHVDDIDEGNVSDGLSPEDRSRQYCAKIASEELERYRKRLVVDSGS